MNEKYHFIGIGGIGMSGLARILLEGGVEVSGSDLTINSIMKTLQEKGAKIFTEHSGRHISPSMTVVFSTSIAQDNPEYQAAVLLGCRMLHRSDLLLELMEGSKTLAVTGTHGKTTTSALLAWVLSEAGFEPSFAVGGMLTSFQSNAKQGGGEYFVVEADESDGTFLKYAPHGAIVTNIGFEHMDHFQTEEMLLRSFKTFLERVENPDLFFWCGDDERLRKLAQRGTTYGFEEGCQLRATNFCQRGWTSCFDVSFEEKKYSAVEASLTGKHNVSNVLAVFGFALRLGIEETQIRRTLKSFQGVSRRCEKKGEAQEVLFIDDYAHHPTEIKAILHAIRQAVKNRRLIAVFQPHRYTRTKDCLGSYGNIFDEVDELLITDIHAAGEAPIPGISSETILAEVQKNSKIPSFYVSHDNLVAQLSEAVRPTDVVVTLGAGNITQIGPETMKALKKMKADG
ncbi:MAG: UDP-N-acetylmuramate--L-alanine ligase [Chlamydiae bacterium]|nr:UDP-N-acetylmuramate--L-alanine ligase [Chlamydiota bacterium]